MRLDWALLANAAEAPPNGLVYILGAGFDTLVRLQRAIRAINGLEPWDPTWNELTYESVLARCIPV